MKEYKKVLTIAGSDSGGGAGIQADLKSFSACGCFGMSAITAITAQNTLGVSAIHAVPVDILEAQIRAVVEDIGVDAVKIGMLHSVEVIETVAKVLREYKLPNVVLDPVMVATSGDRLIHRDAVTAMGEYLFPLVRLITPNLPEAEILLGEKIESESSMEELAHIMVDTLGTSVLAKGGHSEGNEVVDVLCESESGEIFSYTNPRIHTENSHGTGCSLSSAIAAYLAHGHSLDRAVAQAIAFVHQGLQAGADYKIGGGHGPIHHFHRYW